MITHITYYRVLGVLSILMFHFVSQHPSDFVSLSTQLFNIGVNIFILASGFLAAINHNKYDYAWFIKRIKRIYVPSTLFVIVLALVYSYKNLTFNYYDWLLLLIGCQGTIVNVLGAEQTWFISVILICYLITPFIDYVYRLYWKNNSKTISLLFMLIPLLFTPLDEDWYYTLFAPIAWYCLSFYYGKMVILKQKYDIIPINTAMLIILIIIMYSIRFIGHFLIHDTILYRRIIVGYSHYIAAFCLLFLFARFLNNKEPSNIVKYFHRNSFEIYLYHYMFCVGPIYLFLPDFPWLLNCISVLTITLFLAQTAKIIEAYIEKRLSCLRNKK